jgi:hypothetical protein
MQRADKSTGRKKKKKKKGKRREKEGKKKKKKPMIQTNKKMSGEAKRTLNEAVELLL